MVLAFSMEFGARTHRQLPRRALDEQFRVENREIYFLRSYFDCRVFFLIVIDGAASNGS
jgi:hypothetical protein